MCKFQVPDQKLTAQDISHANNRHIDCEKAIAERERKKRVYGKPGKKRKNNADRKHERECHKGVESPEKVRLLRGARVSVCER